MHKFNRTFVTVPQINGGVSVQSKWFWRKLRSSWWSTNCLMSYDYTLNVSGIYTHTQTHYQYKGTLAMLFVDMFCSRLWPGGLVVITGRKSASMSSSSRSWTWSHTAAKTLPPTHHSTTNTSSTSFLLWSCIMGRASARAITPPSVTTQREVGDRRIFLD